MIILEIYQVLIYSYNIITVELMLDLFRLAVLFSLGQTILVLMQVVFKM